jgi:hypothetical protein
MQGLVVTDFQYASLERLARDNGFGDNINSSVS